MKKIPCERRKVNTCLCFGPRSPHKKNKATLLYPNLILPTGAPFRPQIPNFYLVKLKLFDLQNLKFQKIQKGP